MESSFLASHFPEVKYLQDTHLREPSSVWTNNRWQALDDRSRQALRLYHANPFLTRMRLYVESRLTEDLDIESLSRSLYLTRTQVYRKTKQLTGKSPSRFVRTIRLSIAAKLLLTSQLSISQIAYKVGFTDPKYFSRVFASELGQSPTAFRQLR